MTLIYPGVYPPREFKDINGRKIIGFAVFEFLDKPTPSGHGYIVKNFSGMGQEGFSTALSSFKTSTAIPESVKSALSRAELSWVFCDDQTNFCFGLASSSRELSEVELAALGPWHEKYCPSKFLSNPPTHMSNILDFFKNLTASTEEKLLLKHGIEDPIGTPTSPGLALSAQISYTENRAAIIEVARQLEAEEQAKK